MTFFQALLVVWIDENMDKSGTMLGSLEISFTV